MFFKQRNKHTIDSLLDAKTTIDGDIQFASGMQIHGRVKGNIKGLNQDAILVIGKDALIEGSIEVANVFIDGRVVGPIKGCQTVVIRPNGNVTGDVHYGKIQMEEGAIIKGQLYPIPGVDEQDAQAVTSGREDGLASPA